MMKSAPAKIKIAIVDDHAILRYGLKKILNAMPGTEVIIEASNGQEFIDALDSVLPDLAIIDINMPVMRGDEAIRIVKKKYPEMKVIVLSMNNEENLFKSMNETGVDGYVIKESEYDELERAIQCVIKGGKYFSQELLLRLIQNKSTDVTIVLTEREREILQYICQGLGTNEIAEKLFISPRTVEKHRSELLLRTSSPNSISLVVFAIKHGLVTI